MAERLALVLAGGGIGGIAWETGFLLGVRMKPLRRSPPAGRGRCVQHWRARRCGPDSVAPLGNSMRDSPRTDIRIA